MRETMTSHWSLTLDHSFEPVRAAKNTKNTTTNSNNNNTNYRISILSLYNKNVVNNNIYRASDASYYNSRLTTSTTSSSYALSTCHRGDSEVKRKQRIASYKAYAVENKFKTSARNSFRWMKNKYSYFVHGY
ncbi:hypothetical protein ACH5RR_031046 [Cinchona calisaya]|uniref:Uncharacterized protein n=1 Tax=Cinchona calisaya TaxID=153742 RepID=A0ABD2YE22_9GENT